MDNETEKGQKSTVLQGKARELVLRLHGYFTKEWENNGPLIPVARITERVANGLGISRKLVLRLLEEGDKEISQDRANKKSEVNIIESREIKKEQIEEENKIEEDKIPVYELVVNLVKQFTKEWQNNGPLIPVTKVTERVANGLGISRDLVLRLLVEEEEISKKSEVKVESIEIKKEQKEEENKTAEVKSPVCELVVNTIIKKAIKLHAHLFIEKNPEASPTDLLDSLKNCGLFQGTHYDLLRVLGHTPGQDENSNKYIEINKVDDNESKSQLLDEKSIFKELLEEAENNDQYNYNKAESIRMKNEKRAHKRRKSGELTSSDSSIEKLNVDEDIKEAINKDIKPDIFGDCDELDEDEEDVYLKTLGITNDEEYAEHEDLPIYLSGCNSLRSAVILHADLFYKNHPNSTFKSLVKSFKESGLYPGAYKALLKNIKSKKRKRNYIDKNEILRNYLRENGDFAPPTKIIQTEEDSHVEIEKEIETETSENKNSETVIKDVERHKEIQTETRKESKGNKRKYCRKKDQLAQSINVVQIEEDSHIGNENGETIKTVTIDERNKKIQTETRKETKRSRRKYKRKRGDFAQPIILNYNIESKVEMEENIHVYRDIQTETRETRNIRKYYRKKGDSAPPINIAKIEEDSHLKTNKEIQTETKDKQNIRKYYRKKRTQPINTETIKIKEECDIERNKDNETETRERDKIETITLCPEKDNEMQTETREKVNIKQYYRKKRDFPPPINIKTTTTSIKIEENSNVDRDKEIPTDTREKETSETITVKKEEIENDFDDYFETEESVMNSQGCVFSC